MAKVLLDTSVYIPWLRNGTAPLPLLQSPNAILYLSAVVLQELLAGAVDRRTTQLLDALHETFAEHERVVVPNEQEWIRCGKVLAAIGMQHGFETIRKVRLVNDVLIALSAARLGSELWTANHRDFRLIAEHVPCRILEV
ncbi:MAG: type II toxin-antitoxin system VapC family toxin [Deltaproteobacteria bacterium]|nr:type II toxin-antitoxin system VapC family toxin [Deltaproteobacteria bacterium]